MCGIVGEFAVEAHNCTTSIPALTSMMIRRGPDGQGYWSDGQHCTLGFRRLAILDLAETGDQPMSTADGRYTIAFNGEVYNFKELRHQLERDHGARFRSSGDTEVVLQALQIWGVSALNRFNGMFAIALYDSIEKTLLLARDHAGIKPLYYHITSLGIVFASQYDQLLAHPWGYDLAVDPYALSDYIRHGYIQAPSALHYGTHLLNAGHWLSFTRDGKSQIDNYFVFPSGIPASPLTGQTAFDAVNQAIQNAVQRQMVSDVPIGTFLSGGIDSPLIAAIMAENATAPLRAYTIGTNDPKTDELNAARNYATEIGIDHVYEIVDTTQALELVLVAVGAASEPLADYSIIPTFLVSRLARRDATVVLSGDGGDELFWGYFQRFSRIIALSSAYAQPYWWRLIQAGLARVSGHHTKSYDLRWRTLGERYRAAHSTLPPRQMHYLLPELPNVEQRSLFEFDGYDPDQTAYWVRNNEFTGHLTRVLMKVDRASMAHSLEVRVPLLDREVIEIATQVDFKTCFSFDTGQGKLPLRNALKRRFSYQTQAKKGFVVPMSEWLRGPLRPLIYDLLLRQQTILGFPFNQRFLKKMVNDHINQKADYTQIIWTLLSLYLWEEKYVSAKTLNQTYSTKIS